MAGAGTIAAELSAVVSKIDELEEELRVVKAALQKQPGDADIKQEKATLQRRLAALQEETLLLLQRNGRPLGSATFSRSQGQVLATLEDIKISHAADMQSLNSSHQTDMQRLQDQLDDIKAGRSHIKAH